MTEDKFPDSVLSDLDRILVLAPIVGKRHLSTPYIYRQHDFPERRHQLPEASEETRKEYRLVAQEAVIRLTRESNTPLRGGDDFMNRVAVEEGFNGGSMEQLLETSITHLEKMCIDVLSDGEDSLADRLTALADRLRKLKMRHAELTEEPRHDVSSSTESGVDVSKKGEFGTTNSLELSSVLSPAQTRRGRPLKFSESMIEKARELRASGKGNRAAAQVLFGPNPTRAQCNNIPKILAYRLRNK